ncbi:hypothetical protein [Helicobacter turcicus]|uniref:Integral membrane protein n=1 Tax=Helicobacter turcicus TaxID=2867412 RepID=A0ABS7JPA3_9HELI|nr:hypothetical protein [Helicobacter turcicus]MBX7491218.1 hypothetical protein [Helicobacter turcicus]MBX7546143.1 hypothetical protein [Helicobacter turcicus]
MTIKTPIKTSKFPYFFWGFNKAYPCELDFIRQSYINTEANTKYAFKEMNFYVFLGLKYIPVLFAFYFSFSRYDFAFNKHTLSAYILALFLALMINTLENLARKIGVALLIAFSLLLSYLISDVFLIAYVFKYFLLFSVLILLYLDSKLMPFYLMDKGRIVSNFLIPKELLKQSGIPKDSKTNLKENQEQKESIAYKVEVEK